MKRIIIVLFIAAGFSLQLLGTAPGTRAGIPQVSVEPRVELMSLIFRLAGNNEYNQCRIPSYNRDVEQYFEKHKNHRVVELARELRKTRGVSYDAVMSMAVHIDDIYRLGERIPFNPRPPTLEKRWPVGKAREFLVAAREFVRESHFQAFIDKHQSLYDTAVTRMGKVLREHGRFDWFDTFFGRRPGARFRVILGLMNGGACYGARIRLPGDSEELYGVMGTWSTDDTGLPSYNRDYLPTIIHEFSHSYINPLVDKYAPRLEKSGQKIFPLVSKAMQAQAYGSWETMMVETMVRASVLRYGAAVSGPAKVKAGIEREIKNKFIWIEDVFNLLGEYEKQRDEYPSMDAFFPKIIEYFNRNSDKIVAKVRKIQEEEDKKRERMKARSPKVKSTMPVDGDRRVDPDLEFIKITFDRPMRDRSWAMVAIGITFPKIAGEISYDAGRTVLTVPVKLEPGREYGFGLNSARHEAFVSEEGVPLAPVRVVFKTREREK